jgi:CIC family chloride channel protein
MTDTNIATPAIHPEIAGEDRTLSLPVLIGLACLIGVVAALGAVVFRAMISGVHNLFFLGKIGFFYDANLFDPASPWGPFIILAPVIGGLIVVWLVQTFAPEAKGHGVPEVMYAVYHRKGNVRGIVAVVKSIASAISIGSGASVGREGPIIQIGASFGSTLARRLSLARWQKITLLSAGAGAGIAATFNTPLGGVMFAVELLLPEVSNRTFLPVVVATTTATSIGRFVFGLDPAFYVPEAALPHEGLTINPIVLAGFAILGLAAGVASWGFVRFLAWCEDFFPRLPGNAYTQNAIGMVTIGVLFYIFELTTGHPHTSGVGYATIQSVLSGGMTGLGLLVALFFGKLFATSISLGAGASGGVFSPSLFIGATLGAAFGALGTLLFPETGFSVVEFAVVGMGAVVGGATGASMTAIVMIFEMTRDYNVMVPLVLAVALATGIRRALITENIYTIKLRHRGRPIPTIRHTNMYLVRQARELMNKDFIVLPIDTSIADALAAIAERPQAHVIVSDGPRIVGVARLAAGSYTPDRYAEQTLRSVTEEDFVISPDTAILNTIITRMNRRTRSLAIVVNKRARIPRPEDVVGIIAPPEIASAVIANHYA